MLARRRRRPRRPSRSRGSRSCSFHHFRFPGCGSAWKKPDGQDLAVVRVEELAAPPPVRASPSGASRIGAPDHLLHDEEPWRGQLLDRRRARRGASSGRAPRACARCWVASRRKSSSRRSDEDRCSMTAGRSTSCRNVEPVGRLARRTSRAGRGRGRCRCAGARPLHLDDDPVAALEPSPGAPGRSSRRPSASARCGRRRPPTARRAPRSMTATTSASVERRHRLLERRELLDRTPAAAGPGRVERIWPSFAKVGPSSSSAWRRRSARARLDT